MDDEQVIAEVDGMPLKQKLELERIRKMFDYYGLSSFYSEAVRLVVQEGITDDNTLYQALSALPEWGERFKGNKMREQAGLKPLLPAEYLLTEDAHRQVMMKAGLPSGFYDSPDDFAGFIAKDISPDEVNQRVSWAVQRVDSVDPVQRRILRDYYGLDSRDIAAYFLDPEKSTEVLAKRERIVDVGTGAAAYGFNVSLDQASIAVDRGMVAQQTNYSFQSAAADRNAASRLGAIHGEQVSESDLIDEALGQGNAGDITAKKKRLAAKERAAFSGTSGLSQGSLSQRRQGI